MELIRTLRDKAMTRKQEDIHRMAMDYITLSDFDNSLFIAYQGAPLVQIDESSTTKDIIQKLSEVRQNFINSKMKEVC